MHDVPNKKYLEEYLNFISPMRNQILDIQNDTDIGVFPSLRLEKLKVLGRKAFNRRQNLFLNNNNQLIFSSGSQLIITQLNSSISNYRESDQFH